MARIVLDAAGTQTLEKPQSTAMAQSEKPQSEKPRPAKEKRVVRATAESMAAKQKDISVSEFFAKNRHLLGFDDLLAGAC